jgi:hypothetical protein
MVASQEVTMHIHASQMNINAINPYSAAAEKAVAAQRAADVRKKLMKSAQEIEGELTPEVGLMIDHWSESQQNPYRTATPPK